MGLFDELELKPIRLKPDVWVNRLVLLERIFPEPTVIRDVHLKPGLNIIRAEDTEGDNPSGEITGHSAGKTTFCRLLRYILGERTFGTRSTVELVRRAFPEGYVAAELFAYGQRWAVRRPFGIGRMTYIKEDCGIETLLAEKGRPVSQESYTKEIGLDVLLSRLGTGEIVQTREPIRWGHILAWCTRDQETRFQSIYDWRSARSESESPSFRFPKSGPLFVIRAVLGLFLSDELKGEETVAGLQVKKDILVKQIDERKREPDFRVNLYNGRLLQLLKNLLPNEPDIDSQPFMTSNLSDDTARMTEKARKIVEEDLEDTRREMQALQNRIDSYGAELQQNKSDLQNMRMVFAMYEAAERELLDGISDQDEELKKLEELKSIRCRFGNILFRDCVHVQQRISVPRIGEYQDLKAMEEKKRKRVETQRIIKEQQDDYIEQIETLENERKALIEERERLSSKAEDTRDTLRDLDIVWSELIKWMDKRDRPADEYEELSLLQQELDTVENEITRIQDELHELIRQHDTNKEVLATIFSWVVKSVLSSGLYNGEVNLDGGELSFRISNGPLMTGEAVETLGVLLADISCLLYSSITETAHLPGFLIHDSPREADLSLGIYHTFIRLVGSLDTQFGLRGSSPFQYIITTTTPPPPDLNTDRFVILKLSAANPQDLLFKKNIADLNMNRHQDLLI